MLQQLSQFPSSIKSEIRSHVKLLVIDRKGISAFFSSPYRLALIVLFSGLFLPQAFVVVKDINFVLAYEVDPGSMIQSTLSLFQNHYNMNGGYHSQYYGWTYFAINFLVLAPVYIAKSLNIFHSNTPLFVTIRLTFFAIGLSTVLAYFELVKRTLKQEFVALVAALLFIASPLDFQYFYFLHPETTGLLFLFISVLCLLRYSETQATDYRWYTLGFISLVLSALSKHVFFFLTPAVLFLYLYFYCHYHRISILRFLVSREFTRVLLISILLSLLLFFVINPFAFIQWQVFIKNQVTLFTVQTGSPLPLGQAIAAWISIMRGIPILWISLLLSPFLLIGALILLREQKTGKILFAASIIGSVLFVTIISLSLRYIIASVYFMPVYPFFILNILSIPVFAFRRWDLRPVKFAIVLLCAALVVPVLVQDLSITLPAGYARFRYQDTLIYKSYAYIEDSVPKGSRIAHDQFVAIPSNRGIEGCSYWQGCGTDYIEEFHPNYVMLAEDWDFYGAVLPQRVRLEKYIQDHHFVLVQTLAGPSAGLPEIYHMAVWKQP